jgi:hypothetical protein
MFSPITNVEYGAAPVEELAQVMIFQDPRKEPASLGIAGTGIA